MTDLNESKIVKAGSKTYFFDLRETKEGQPFLTITETRYKGEGQDRERSSIVVFPDNALDFLEATQEMIDEGYHREAVAWIWVLHYLSNAAVQNDAPEEEKPQFQAGFDHLLSELGLLAPHAWPSRLRQAQQLIDEIFGISDGIVASHPDIFD